MFHFLDDRLNPLLLRELRQLVRNRFIIVLINLFVAVLVTACVLVVLFNDQPQSRGIGGGLFAGLTGIMGVACFLAVVVYTALVTASERINGDLMFASALKPSSIVLGKFFSGVILTFLLMSVTFPFVTLAYLLRGLDIQQMLLSFATTFLTIQLMNSLAIFVFSNVKTYTQMFVALFGGGFLCLFGLNGIVSYFIFRTFRSHVGIGSSGDEWAQLLSLFLTEGALLVLLLTAAVASVAPPTSNRFLPLRVAVTAIFVLSLAYCTFLLALGGSSDILAGWAVSWMSALMFLLLLVVCERETWSFRVKRAIPRNFVFRILCFPFYTGSPCGLVWVSLLGAGIALVAPFALPTGTDNLWLIAFGLLFAFDYCVTAMLVRSFFLSKRVPPDKTWTLVLSQFLLFTFGGMMIFYLTMGDAATYDFGDTYSQHFLAALNPFLLGDNYDQTLRIFAATGWAVLLALPLVFWFGAKVRDFSPTSPSDVMTLDEAVAFVRHADENPLVKGKRT